MAGNAIFMLITGYFMSARGTPRKTTDISLFDNFGPSFNVGPTVWKTVSMLLFASVFLMFGSTFCHLIDPERFHTALSIDEFVRNWWYFGWYISIVLSAAFFLNKLLSMFDKREFTIFLIVLFALFSLGWTGELLDSLAKGHHSGLRYYVVGIFLYSLGGYIKRFKPFDNLHWWVFALLIFIVYVVLFVSQYNVTITQIDSFAKNSDAFKQVLPRPGLYHPAPLIIAVCLFELFRRINIPTSKVINFLGAATFMIYPVHENSFTQKLYMSKKWINALINHKSSPELFLLFFKWTVVLFIAGVVCYVCYLIYIRLFNRCKKVFLINP